MKALLILLLSLFWVYKSEAQIIKRLGEQIKRDAEWRVRYKADQQINKGLDSVAAIPKKIKDKKKAKKNNTEKVAAESNNNNSAKSNDQNPTGNIKAPASDEDDMTPKDGYITLKLSATSVFTGGAIRFTGESVKHKQYSSVEITVTGPSTKDVRTIALSTDGKYVMDWTATEKTGDFTVTVKSSDKKAQQKEPFTVEGIEWMDNWGDESIEETNKAYDKLKKAVAKAEPGISGKNKAELEKKMDDLKDKVDDVLKLFKDLNTAGKETAALAKSGKKLPPTLAGNLSELNNTLAGHAREMKTFQRLAEHEPQDNTICEYLVMVNEACAAFSTFTNFKSKAIGTIVKNIILDKGVPKVVGEVNNAAGGVSAPYDFPLKELSKIYATSKFDAQSLTEKLGKAGIAGDIIQFASDVLLKSYCGLFTGSFTHDYTIEFRNSSGETWWSYGVKMKAVLSLRYPKKDISSTVIKMKGNLEGNGTDFSFFEDVEKEDGFQEGSKGKIEVVPIKTFIPLSVSFATSERDVLGFGAIARGLATPAYFNIAIDAEYDVDADKIKIFVNRALLDFTDLIATQFVFLLVGGDLFPYIKKMNFPIHKALATIGSIIRSNNEFTVNKDANGNLSFSGKANKHIGDKSTVRETDLNFTISAKKE